MKEVASSGEKQTSRAKRRFSTVSQLMQEKIVHSVQTDNGYCLC
jgi:hypothetical protein